MSEPSFALRPMGDRALLVETGDLDSVLAIAARLRSLVGRWPDVVEVVPAARTVLVVTRPGSDLGQLHRTLTDELTTLAAVAPRDDPRSEVILEVRYDGPDLSEVAEHLGLSRAEVITAHSGRRWQVAFTGFAPGFAYLVPVADVETTEPIRALHVSRRSSPRPTVPAGAVGLAGDFCGIYPRPSPGGWQLIGTTDAPLWDPHRTAPALLTPGTTVRFVPMDAP